MLKDLKVAAVQAKVPLTAREGEIQVKRLVKEAVFGGVDMVGLPEDCVAPWSEIREGYNAFDFLSSIAKENNVYLFGASTVLGNGKIYDRAFLFDRTGNLVAIHNKIVLTPIEEKELTAGKTLEVFNTEFGKMSLLVCKDSFHRYAAWFFDKLRREGVDVVLVPSYSLSVSKRSIGLWVDSLNALSKWFDVYVVAPGTVGPNSTDFPSFGHSLIISPGEEVLAEGSFDKEVILTATLSAKSLNETKKTVGSKWQPQEVPEVRVKEIKT